MRIASNFLFLERILVQALGINTFRYAKIMKSRIGEEYLFLQSRTIATKPNHRLNGNSKEFLDDMLDCVNNDKDKIVVQISMLEFRRLSNWCSAIAKEIQERNFSLVIAIQDFSTLNLEIGINPFKIWSTAFGLSFSQHPKLASIFLVDYEYRFHEKSGKLSRYEEIRKTFQNTDKNHSGTLYFVMEGELVKRLETNDIYLLETIKDLNNFEEIHSSSVTSTSRNGSVYCDETGIFLRRRYITGTTLTSFLESDSPKKAAKLLLLACSELSKMRIFPNDLRPWNLVYEQNQCRLIDFPKNINRDDDTNGIPNFISLLIVLEYLKEIELETFEAISSKVLSSICLHAEIYNPDSFGKLELAWLNLEKYISSIILFAEGQLTVEAILDEVFNE